MGALCIPPVPFSDTIKSSSWWKETLPIETFMAFLAQFICCIQKCGLGALLLVNPFPDETHMDGERGPKLFLSWSTSLYFYWSSTPSHIGNCDNVDKKIHHDKMAAIKQTLLCSPSQKNTRWALSWKQIKILIICRILDFPLRSCRSFHSLLWKLRINGSRALSFSEIYYCCLLEVERPFRTDYLHFDIYINSEQKFWAINKQTNIQVNSWNFWQYFLRFWNLAKILTKQKRSS